MPQAPRVPRPAFGAWHGLHAWRLARRAIVDEPEPRAKINAGREICPAMARETVVAASSAGFTARGRGGAW